MYSAQKGLLKKKWHLKRVNSILCSFLPLFQNRAKVIGQIKPHYFFNLITLSKCEIFHVFYSLFGQSFEVINLTDLHGHVKGKSSTSHRTVITLGSDQEIVPLKTEFMLCLQYLCVWCKTIRDLVNGNPYR